MQRLGTAYLIVDGLKFHSTWREGSKREAQQVIDRSLKYKHPLTMRPYGVDIQTINPHSNEVLTWNKVKGYSLWEPLSSIGPIFP